MGGGEENRPKPFLSWETSPQHNLKVQMSLSRNLLSLCRLLNAEVEPLVAIRYRLRIRKPEFCDRDQMAIGHQKAALSAGFLAIKVSVIDCDG